MALAVLTSTQASPEVIINENFLTLAAMSIYAQKASTTTGLVLGYYGGQWGAFSVADGTVTLTTATTNYVVVLRSSGVVSSSTATTNWNNTTLYARMGIGVCGASTITSYTDYRGGLNGTHGPYGILADQTNVFAKTQSVTPQINATATGTVTPDASLSNNWRLTLTGNLTLANPTNLTDGMVLNFRLKQDATGGRTHTFGSKFKWPAGTQPVWVTTANAVNFFSCYYDAGDDILISSGSVGYA